MGEVDQLEDPVDERQADRAERVDRAEESPFRPVWATSCRPLATTSATRSRRGSRRRQGPAAGRLIPADADGLEAVPVLRDRMRSGLHSAAHPTPGRAGSHRASLDHRVGELGRPRVAAQVRGAASRRPTVSSTAS